MNKDGFTNMQPIPRDIIDKTNRLFNNAEDAYEAHTLLASLWTRGLNVGPAQLARSILSPEFNSYNKPSIGMGFSPCKIIAIEQGFSPMFAIPVWPTIRLKPGSYNPA